MLSALTSNSIILLQAGQKLVVDVYTQTQHREIEIPNIINIPTSVAIVTLQRIVTLTSCAHGCQTHTQAGSMSYGLKTH